MCMNCPEHAGDSVVPERQLLGVSLIRIDSILLGYEYDHFMPLDNPYIVKSRYGSPNSKFSSPQIYEKVLSLDL